MRIFTAGIATETNTFCPVPTGRDDFTVQRGRDVLTGSIDYPSLDLTQIWGAQAKARCAELIFSLNAWAQPSGITLRATYEALRDEILADLQAAMPVNMVLLMLHGAMVAEGYENTEEDLVTRIRTIVGTDVTIGVELDLHCHLTNTLVNAVNAIVTYKEYPHLDVSERAHELFDLTYEACLGKINPTMALFDCAMIGLYPTSREPLRSLVHAMKEAEQRPGVLSVSFAHSFQFADVHRLGAKMLAMTDGDLELAREVAAEFGMRAYRLRREIGFDAISLPMEQALTQALASSRTPVVVADQSDNVGAGAPGDSTFAIRWLLAQGARDVAVAIVHDPEAVKLAKKVGVGSRVKVRLGGKTGLASGDPLDLDVLICVVRESYMHDFPQQSGQAVQFPVGDVVALRCSGIDIVVGSERCQCYSPGILEDLGIDPMQRRILVVKSTQHFYGAFAPIAAEVIYMSSPGAAMPDPRRISYTNIDTRRLYPWADDPLNLGR